MSVYDGPARSAIKSPFFGHTKLKLVISVSFFLGNRKRTICTFSDEWRRKDGTLLLAEMSSSISCTSQLNYSTSNCQGCKSRCAFACNHLRSKPRLFDCVGGRRANVETILSPRITSDHKHSCTRISLSVVSVETVVNILGSISIDTHDHSNEEAALPSSNQRGGKRGGGGPINDTSYENSHDNDNKDDK